jgi:hypothetical protein
MYWWFGKSDDPKITEWTAHTWTTEPPKEAGWYWVNFRVGTANFQLIEKYPLDGKEQNIHLATHWLGPLPVPEPPEN